MESSLYSTPSPGIVIKWYDSTPDDFHIAAKLPQAITLNPDPKAAFPRHPLQGHNRQATLDHFADTIGLLQDKFTPVVVQLPPQWHWRPENLSRSGDF